MKIHGFNKTTLLDYPEHLAATIFTGGCNFRCPFCHNGGLVLDPDSQPVIPEKEVLKFLQKRRGILEGVCITGGEPTLQPDLEDFIGKIKEMGYLVKLDTNGSRPEVLKSLLEKGLLDYVAMDIKASRENYAWAAGMNRKEAPNKEPVGDVLVCKMATVSEKIQESKEMPASMLDKVEVSVNLLKSSAIPYEFRTTVVKGIHTPEEFETIGQWLAGCRAYYLQDYRENENILAYCGNAQASGDVRELKRLSSFSKEEMENMADMARKYISKVELRGVE